jgi:hypothetical protein
MCELCFHTQSTVLKHRINYVYCTTKPKRIHYFCIIFKELEKFMNPDFLFHSQSLYWLELSWLIKTDQDVKGNPTLLVFIVSVRCVRNSCSSQG